MLHTFDFVKPQYVIDWLPHPGGEQSILPLDQLQLMGRHHHAYKPAGYRLSDAALDVTAGWNGSSEDLSPCRNT